MIKHPCIGITRLWEQRYELRRAVDWLHTIEYDSILSTEIYESTIFSADRTDFNYNHLQLKMTTRRRYQRQHSCLPQVRRACSKHCIIINKSNKNHWISSSFCGFPSLPSVFDFQSMWLKIFSSKDSLKVICKIFFLQVCSFLERVIVIALCGLAINWF